MKKVIGRTDMEDALARLDRLTQEEVRMAAAQGLKATHAVHEEVKSADDHIQRVDDRVQGVGSDVQQVDTHVQRVDDKVQGVDNKVQQVSDHIGDQKRSSSNNPISLAMNAQFLSQVISYERTSETGFPPQIRL